MKHKNLFLNYITASLLFCISITKSNSQCRTVDWTDSLIYAITCTGCIDPIPVEYTYYSFLLKDNQGDIYTSGKSIGGYPDPYTFIRRYDSAGVQM